MTRSTLCLAVLATCACLSLAIPTSLSIVSRQTCRPDGERCLGAAGRPSVPWRTCCSGSCSHRRAGQWGMFCAAASAAPPGAATCRAAGERCKGAPGRPPVPWLECCGSERCLDVTDAADYGARCTGGRDDSDGTDAPDEERPPVIESDGTCHPNGARCVGAPGRPAVPWLPCCGGGNCVDSDDWGKVCEGGSTAPDVPPSNPNCHDSDVRCQGAPGRPFVQWKPCCVTGEECLPADDWGFTCQNPAGGSVTITPETTVAVTTRPVDVTTQPDVPDVTTTVPTLDETTTTQAVTTTVPQTTVSGEICPNDHRVRKDVRDLTAQEWNDFVDAVRSLHAETGSNGLSGFETFAQAHRDASNYAHSGPYFLVWHRAHLFNFESALRRHNPSVTLPYVDWSVRNDNFFEDDAVFSRVGGGGDGSGTAGPIPDGPFRGWTSRVPNSHLVERGFSRDRPLASRANLDIGLTRATYAGFCFYIEGVHNAFHSAIGGDMNSLWYSPNEILFYLHHAFIDKLYWEWQRIGDNAGRFGGRHPFREDNSGTIVDVETELTPWGVTCSQVITGMTGCASYQELSSRPSMATPLSRQETATVVDTDVDPDYVDSSVVQAKREYAPTPGSVTIDTVDAPPPAKIQNTSEKRNLQKKVAEKKRDDPETYRREVVQAKMERETAATACKQMGWDDSMVEAFKKEFAVVELKLGVDITEDIDVKSDDDLSREGREDVDAIDRGDAPQNNDDSDVKHHDGSSSALGEVAPAATPSAESDSDGDMDVEATPEDDVSEDGAGLEDDVEDAEATDEVEVTPEA